MSSCIILYRPKVFNTTLVFLQYIKYIVVHFIFSHVSMYVFVFVSSI